MTTTRFGEFSSGKSALFRFQRDFDVYVAWLFALLMAALFVAAVRVDMRLALWTDEIITVLISDQPTISEMFGAIRGGADSQPPFTTFSCAHCGR